MQDQTPSGDVHSPERAAVMQVMDTDDAVELTSALRGIMSENVFSSEEKQKYYKRCMSDDEWDREWAPSIERARVRREKSKKAAEPGGKS